MYGSAYLLIEPEYVGLNRSDLAGVLPVRGNASHDQMENFRAFLAQSSLPGHLTPCNNLNQDNAVTVTADGLLKVRMDMKFLVRTGKFNLETMPGVPPHMEALICFWIHPTGSCSVKAGAWHNEEQSIGALVSRDPSQKDPSRLYIEVEAPTSVWACETLRKVLRGDMKFEDLSGI